MVILDRIHHSKKTNEIKSKTKTMDKINKDLKILFWNCQSIANKKELQKITENLDMFVCVESWLSDKTPPEENFHLNGFKTFRKDRQYSRGGEPPVTLFPKILGTVFSITLTRYQQQFLWVTLMPTIKRLLSSLINSNLIFHNTNTITRTQYRYDTNSISNSNLDLVFSSSSIADKINVKVNKGTWGSDHFPLFIDLQISKSIYRKQLFKINSVRTNWNNVYVNLDENYQKFLSSEFAESSASEKYTLFIELISDAIILSTPKKKYVNNQIHRNPVPWWDSECGRIRRLRTATFKKYQFTECIKDLIKFKKIRAEAKKLEYVIEYASNINFFSNPKYVWRVGKNLKNKWTKIRPSHTSEHHQSENAIELALNKI
ncbi:hypothetical protein TSAR_003914, partial [Trichomalopsis sarcophagae]